MLFRLGSCRFSRFIFSHILCLALTKSLVVFLQTHVTLKRIAVYLDEEEVTDQVSSLKKDYTEPCLFGDDEGLGLECATLKWNEVVEVEKQLGQIKFSSSSTVSLADEANTVVDAESIDDRGDRVFELRNMTIRFPEGELTVVTGPTASGKTALLVSS
jgi:ABC-type multidrug transport system fused ATPase/permease subunit